jgi:hypothetical protein
MNVPNHFLPVRLIYETPTRNEQPDCYMWGETKDSKKT